MLVDFTLQEKPQAENISVCFVDLLEKMADLIG